LLPLLALSFRRGWISLWLLVVLAPLPRAEAFEWQDLWKRADQRGFAELRAENPARAAELFDSAEWRGAAHYRAGQFEASAASLTNIDSAAGHYNRGNALAKAGQLQAAIAAYDRALELEPSHDDARYNRDLVQQLLEDNPPQEQPPNQGQGEQGQQGDSDQAQSESGEQENGEQASDDQQGEQGEQGQSGESQAGEGAQDPPDEETAGEPQGEEDPTQNANAGEQQSEEATQTAAGPEEVERWASEQAAEQWLRRVPQDPGGLLRRKFLYQYQRLGVDQNGNRVLDGPAAEQRPW